MLKTVDELDPKSREFYERARFKLALSLILAAVVSAPPARPFPSLHPYTDRGRR